MPNFKIQQIKKYGVLAEIAKLNAHQIFPLGLYGFQIIVMLTGSLAVVTGSTIFGWSQAVTLFAAKYGAYWSDHPLLIYHEYARCESLATRLRALRSSHNRLEISTKLCTRRGSIV